MAQRLGSLPRRWSTGPRGWSQSRWRTLLAYADKASANSKENEMVYDLHSCMPKKRDPEWNFSPIPVSPGSDIYRIAGYKSEQVKKLTEGESRVYCHREKALPSWFGGCVNKIIQLGDGTYTLEVKSKDGARGTKWRGDNSPRVVNSVVKR